MKRILAIILCFGMFSVLYTGNAETVGSPEVVCRSVSANPGKTFTVDVELKNNPGIGYIEMTPVYPEKFTLEETKNGTLFDDFTPSRQYIWIANDEDVTEDGKLMTFTFRSSEDTSPGEYEVGFVVRYCTNYDETPINLTVTNAKVTLKKALRGDADGSGRVDTADATAILKYVIRETDVDLTAADADRNGKVDTADATAILKYVIREYSLDD